MALNGRYNSNKQSPDDEPVKRACTYSARDKSIEALLSPTDASAHSPLFRISSQHRTVKREELLDFEAEAQKVRHTGDTVTEHHHAITKNELLERDHTAEDDLRRAVCLQEEEKIYKERCERLAQRIASYEREHGKLLIEAERYRMAAERSATAIQNDRSAEEQERKLLKQTTAELAKVLSRLGHTSKGDNLK